MLLAIVVQMITVASVTAQTVTSHAGSASPSQLQAGQEIHLLTLEQSVEREIAGGQLHRYQVSVSAGQYVRISFEQQGISLIGAFFDESGKQVSETNSGHGMKEPKSVHLLTELAGSYQFQIKPFDPEAKAGKYVLKLQELREATAQDRARIAGEKAYRDAERLNSGLTGDSFRKAAEKFHEAARHFEAAGDIRRQAQALNLMATHYSVLGEKEKAVQLMMAALPVARAAGDLRTETNMVLNASFIYADLSEQQKALEYGRQGLELARKLGDKRLEGMALGILGRIWHNIGNTEKSIEYFESALVLKRESKDRSAEAVSLVNLGTIYLEMGQHQKAIEMMTQAVRLCHEAGNIQLEMAVTGSLGMAYHDAGNNQKALEYLHQTLVSSIERGDKKHEASVLYRIGHIQAETGVYGPAVENLNQALALWKFTANKRGEAATYFYLARCAKEQGDLATADGHIKTALSITESQRGKLDGEEMRSQYFSTVQELYELQMEILFRLHEAQSDQKSPFHQRFLNAALETSERAHARSLLDLLSESRVDIREGISPELKGREKNNHFKLSAIQTQLLQSRQQAKPDLKQLDALTAELKKADEEREQIEREIRQQSPRYAALRYPTPLKADEIRALLDDQTALLEYSIGEKYSLLFVVTREAISAFPLPEAKEIRAQIEELRIALRQPGRREFIGYTKNAQQLYQMLIAPAEKLLATKKRLLIVPDKQLYYVPFESLLTRNTNDSAEVSARELPYLLRQWAVSYVPSASVLASMRQNRPAEKNSGAKEFLAFADPLYQTNPLADRKAPVEKIMQVAMRGSLENEGRLELPRLTESQRETVQIAKLFGAGQSKLFLGENAREENVKNSAELVTARRLHFATHGLISERQPQLSSLVLTLDNDPGEDGLLQMREIFNLKLQADLVVLSACETGLGREMKGEGVIGLTRAFFYAGAASVVVSLWQVADRSTADLMIDFYREMESGADKAEALRRAKLRMIENGRYAHPYYWASFALNGETK